MSYYVHDPNLGLTNNACNFLRLYGKNRNLVLCDELPLRMNAKLH